MDGNDNGGIFKGDGSMITIKTNEKGIELDKNGNIELLDGLDACVQDVQSRVLFNQGENPYDLTDGINYDGDLLGKFGGEEYIKNVYSKQIGKSEDITEVANIEIVRGDKSFSVNAEIKTIYGVTNV